MERSLFEIRELNKKLENAGYDKINPKRASSKEQLGILVLQKMNEVIDSMEITISSMRDFSDADDITDDTYIVEHGIEIAKCCLFDDS